MKLYNPGFEPTAIQAEIAVVSRISFPRIIQAIDYFDKIQFEKRDSSSSEGKSSIVLHALGLEYAPNGDMIDLLKKVNCLPEIAARTYFHQLVEAIEYLHSRNICHLDIKPDNILLDENFGSKLTDFGFSRYLPYRHSMKFLVGTSIYFSPEMHQRKPYNGYQSDLFALGMVLFMLVGGCLPFPSASDKDPYYCHIIKGDFSEFWKIHEKMKGSQKQFYSIEFRSLIESMLVYDPKKRLNLGEIKAHEWYQKSILSDEKLKVCVNTLLLPKKAQSSP